LCNCFLIISYEFVQIAIFTSNFFATFS